jgi:hypothetical protein
MTEILGVISNKQILEVRPLENFEYEKFKIGSSKLSEFTKKQELFRLVDTNYREYKTVLNEYFNIHCEKSDIVGSYLEGMIFNLNRLAINFLSSIFPFLDHSRERLSNEKPEKLENFDNLTHWYYDNYFSYRFLYKLRNYSQHVGMPITGMGTLSEMVNPNPLEANHVLKTVTLKKDLLKFKKWGTVKDEISTLPEKIDIDPYIDEMMYCIKKINASLYEKEETIELLNHTAFLDNLVKEAKSKGGTPVVIIHAEVTDNGLRLTYDHFPVNAMELVDLLNLSPEENF